jgi:hypothetical protein
VAFSDLRAELRGAFPKIPFVYTDQLINRAYNDIRLRNLWSFQLFESSWITPPPLIGTANGTVTTTQGLPDIQFDGAALVAINANQLANPYSLITQRQFRVSVGGVYNLLTYNPLTGAATLDRPFSEPSGVAQSYQIYQVYYTPPMADFRVWISVRNPVYFTDLDLTMTRVEVDAQDPQRLSYQVPSSVVPWGVDLRGAGTTNASPTLNYPMFELWPQPINPFTYQCYGLRKGVPLVDPTDELPPAISADTIMAMARAYAYEWAEANKDIAPRNVGPDFKFLIDRSMAEYRSFLRRDRVVDKDLIDNFFAICRLNTRWQAGYYNTISQTASTTVGGVL